MGTISEEFKDYDENLIFESMNELNIYNVDYGYNTLLNLTQAFINTIINSGDKNVESLLLLFGLNKMYELYFSSEYKLPIGPNNNI